MTTFSTDPTDLIDTADTTELATGQAELDAQVHNVRGTSSPAVQVRSDAHCQSDSGGQTSRGQSDHDGHNTIAPAHTSPQAILWPISERLPPAGTKTDDGGQSHTDDRWTHAPVVTDPDRPANRVATPSGFPLADPALALAADVLDDLEKVRLANENRLRELTRHDFEEDSTGSCRACGLSRDAKVHVLDKDGYDRGGGVAPDHPDVARLDALVQMLAKAEHDATLNLKRVMRRHPLGPWVKSQRGIGEKQAARLLAVIGDPYLNGATGEPRTVSQLWAFSGLHVVTDSAGGDPGQPAREAHLLTAGVAPRRTKGQQSNWSTLAKTRAWLIVEACMKQLDRDCKSESGIADHVDGCTCSPYRVAVDERRKHTAVTHPEWTAAHSLNDGMRIASKRLLRDLWREARDMHAGQP